MGPPRSGQPVIAQVLAMVDSDDPETVVNMLQPLAQIAPLYDANVVITPYASVMANAGTATTTGGASRSATPALIDHITPAFARQRPA